MFVDRIGFVFAFSFKDDYLLVSN